MGLEVMRMSNLNEYGYDDNEIKNMTWETHPIGMLLCTIFAICLVAALVIVVLQVNGVTHITFQDSGWFGPP